MRVATAAALAALGVAVLAAPASAQSSFIPTLVGQVIADQMAAEQAEAACMAGTPPPAELAGDARATAMTVFAIYWRERSDEDRKAVADLFALKAADVDIDVGRHAAGPAAVKAYFAEKGALEPGADAFDPPKPKAVIVAGDAQSVAAIWELPDHRWYAADIVRQRQGWVFLHLTAGGADRPEPPAPVQYCHVRGETASPKR